MPTLLTGGTDGKPSSATFRSPCYGASMLAESFVYWSGEESSLPEGAARYFLRIALSPSCRAISSAHAKTIWYDNMGCGILSRMKFLSPSSFMCVYVCVFVCLVSRPSLFFEGMLVFGTKVSIQTMRFARLDVVIGIYVCMYVCMSEPTYILRLYGWLNRQDFRSPTFLCYFSRLVSLLQTRDQFATSIYKHAWSSSTSTSTTASPGIPSLPSRSTSSRDLRCRPRIEPHAHIHTRIHTWTRTSVRRVNAG
ncbi:hypothetical protein F5X96DRAFT_157716 [Biscogniauxia mediterranea]|nr:hypothetical protein F5X96DRAFT_157716 [Biscogniauxia mediterranea]